MSFKDLNFRLGLVALAGSAFMTFYAIPNWVFSPSNVGNIVLSPTFWPYTLAGFLALTGLGLLLRPAHREAEPDDHDGGAASWLRLAGLAVIMGLTMIALPRLGMVWTSMLAFLVTALMFRTRYPKTALVCAVLIPLVLYAFFAHVAGVAIPQGDFVRLP
ncbi:tripartite tricarboxylate transporter TctB family protein [Aestuariicoccus sp. MJ-SS9]|uniref:tripartite tricarboxylate transporter TctB family protein n=1 Tax=Aestuariicoccus sp. MJ-SS9 TaxID=3079855 RepID=UPI00290BDFA6|nr:tripartite tricarboxylate transporter TctB family protein [Aestuariicoccus sp. MJ-SS9]MDU8913167.1 tripartite tricarboxylate transporter TctB family protein [Aestuariicoccus sp. MJ-SS9]